MNASTAPRIAIVGAGLGGLAAAIALRRRGLDVTVYEQAAALGEVGAGLQLSPNAMKVLLALGLEDAVMRVAFEPAARVGRDGRTGRVIAVTTMKGHYHDTYGAGYYTFHRADLHASLVAALPAGCVRLGAKCAAVREAGDAALIDFADGTTVTADVVIGADGIHSVVRESLFGAQQPRFTGMVCWRGLVPAADMPAGMITDESNSWFGPHSTVVTYKVRGGELVNWAALYEQDWREESWKTEGDPAEVRALYADWHPIVRELMSRTTRMYKWALFDRDPLPAWGRGRISLLGDAAHPMLPSNSQGGCMALEDGYALAEALAMSGVDPAAALRAYEAERMPRTARVQLAARAQLRKNNVVSPLARLRRDLAYRWQRLVDPKRHAYGLEWIYGHDVTTPRGGLPK
jgi:salicylate hydroxylase